MAFDAAGSVLSVNGSRAHEAGCPIVPPTSGQQSGRAVRENPGRLGVPLRSTEVGTSAARAAGVSGPEGLPLEVARAKKRVFFSELRGFRSADFVSLGLELLERGVGLFTEVQEEASSGQVERNVQASARQDAQEPGCSSGEQLDAEASPPVKLSKVSGGLPQSKDVNEGVNEDANRDVTKDIYRDVAKDVNRDVAKDVNGDVTEDVNRDVAKDVNEDVDEGVNWDGKWDVNWDVIQDANWDVSWDVSRDFNWNVNEDANKNVNEDVNVDVNKNANTDVNEDVNKDVNKGFNEDVNEGVLLHVPRATTISAPSSNAPRGSTRQMLQQLVGGQRARGAPWEVVEVAGALQPAAARQVSWSQSGRPGQGLTARLQTALRALNQTLPRSNPGRETCGDALPDGLARGFDHSRNYNSAQFPVTQFEPRRFRLLGAPDTTLAGSPRKRKAAEAGPFASAGLEQGTPPGVKLAGDSSAAWWAPLQRGLAERPGPGFTRGQQGYGIRMRLLQAAEALEMGKQGDYAHVYSQLKPFAKPRGRAMERIVHTMLEVLEAKREGRGFQAAILRARVDPKVAQQALAWYATAHPSLLGAMSTFPLFVGPPLVGKCKVHLVLLGRSLVPFVHLLLSYLRSQERLMQQQGKQGGRLERVRVTVVCPWGLTRPGTTEGSGSMSWEDMGRHVCKVGTQMGLDLEFQALRLTEDSLHCLESIEREPGETVAVVSGSTLCYFPDSPLIGGGPLQHLMKTLARLQPEVVGMGEADCEASGSSFMGRTEAMLDYVWSYFESGDWCSSNKITRLLATYERMRFLPDMLSTIACEGAQRRTCMRSRHSWRRVFEFWGFRMRPMPYSTINFMNNLLNSYPPDGCCVGLDGSAGFLAWKNASIAFTSGLEYVRSSRRVIL